MKKNKLKKPMLAGLVVAITLSAFFFGVVFVEAEDPYDEYGLKTAAEKAKLDVSVSLPELIGNIIGYLLQLIGIILVILFLYGGFMWMTAGGNTEKIKTAQGIIRNAIIGLIIVVAAYSIANFVIARLGTAAAVS